MIRPAPVLAGLTVASFALVLAACGEKPKDAAAPAETAAATPAPAAPTAPPTPEPPPIEKPLEVGSQDAKDDLYCAGIIDASNAEPIEDVIPIEAARIMQLQSLSLGLRINGNVKLMDQKVAQPAQTGAVAGAWADAAQADWDKKKPRIKLDECIKRGEAVPGAQKVDAPVTPITKPK